MQSRSDSGSPAPGAFIQGVVWLAVGTLVFAFRLGGAVFGAGSLYRGYDGAIQSYPWLIKVIDGWRGFELSLWDFGTFSGISFAGEPQTGVFYPLTAVWAWIAPPSEAWLDWFIVFHHGLAFSFMTVLCRRLRLSLPASLLAGLAFSSYLDWSQPNRMFGMVFLPLLLFFFLKSQHRRFGFFNPWIFAAGATLAFSFLAGHHQPPIHSAFCLAVFAGLYILWGTNWRTCSACLLGIGISAVLFSAPQLLLSWQYLGDAYRWTPTRIPALASVSYQQYGFENTLNPRLLEYFAESWIPVVVAAAVLLLFIDSSAWRKWMVRFGLGLGAFSFLATFGDAALVGRLTWHVPILNLIRETERFLFPFLFAASLLLAVSLDGCSEALKLRFQNRRLAWPLWIAAAAGLWWHSDVFLYVQPPGDALSPSRLHPNLSPPQTTPEAQVLSWLRERSREDGGQCRVLNLGDALAPNLGDVYPIRTTSGHRATMHAPYFDFLEGHQGNPLSARFDQLGACYLVTTESFDLPLLLRRGGLSVYRRPGALPVFRLLGAEEGAAAAVAARVNWGLNRVDLELAGPVTGRLVFAQMDYPGWEVRVDGTARPKTVSGPFPAVDLTSADKTVSFLYRPPLLVWGIVLALIPLFAGTVAALRSAKFFAKSSPLFR